MEILEPRKHPTVGIVSSIGAPRSYSKAEESLDPCHHVGIPPVSGLPPLPRGGMDIRWTQSQIMRRDESESGGLVVRGGGLGGTLVHVGLLRWETTSFGVVSDQ